MFRTSNITLQDQRQQNGPEKKTKDWFHQEYEPTAATKQRILFHHLSVLMRVLWQHIWLAMIISSLRGFSSLLIATSPFKSPAEINVTA